MASSELSSAQGEPSRSYKARPDLLKEGEPGTPTGRPLRLYADGVFDLFHYGHMRALEQAKKSYPNTHLIVGCCSDSVTLRYKGPTVMTEKERYESLRHCKWVDEVVEDAPWIVTDEFIEKHRVDYVCHDALPYVDTSGLSEDGDCYAHLRRINKFLETERTEGVSTSDVISRIIVNYDTYVMRQLKRGYTARGLNLSNVKAAELSIRACAILARRVVYRAFQGVIGFITSIGTSVLLVDKRVRTSATRPPVAF